MALRPGGLRSHHSGLRIRGRRRSETTAGARCFLVGNASVSCAGYWSDVADVVVVLERLSTATIGRYLHARPAAEQAAADHLVAAIASVEALRNRHMALVAELLGDDAAAREIAADVSVLFDELAHLAEALSVLGHVTERSLDAVSSLGERLSAPVKLPRSRLTTARLFMARVALCLSPMLANRVRAC